jgi:hypothetical protein
MHAISLPRCALRIGLSALSLAFLVSTISPAQATKPVITLDPQPGGSAAMAARVSGEPTYENAPANFHSFRSVRADELGDAEPLTLRFSATTKLTKIESTKDFRVEQGSSCVEGNIYDAGESCNLLMRFTPQGAGSRLGKLTITHTASVMPMAFGLNGYGYEPVISFTPAQITTVTGTYPSNKGLLSGAQNLTVDGGDTLYVADTGNNLIRSMDSSGAFTTISSGGLSAPLGVIVDTFGEVYFTEPAQNALYEIYAYGPQFQLSGTTASACTTAAPCSIGGQKVYTPGEMATDGYGRIFFVDGYSGASEFVAQSTSGSYAHLNNPFTYQASTPGVITVDTSDNIYSFWYNGGTCSIAMQSFYNASNQNSIYQKIGGGKTCGFAGDGGLAGNAEISKNVGQMALDAAGNLYFTDTGNNRVRRIDYATGIINTIAGTGTAGYGGDSGAATSASLSSPTGVAVDSQGQVYIISNTTAAPAQVIRKLGTIGYLNFGSQIKATAGTAKVVTVSNTGNSTMTLSGSLITGANATDFTIDPVTTSCPLTAGSTLASGQSCKVGFIFKPAATGTRSASFILHGNTVTGSNSVSLVGSGVLPTPTLTITAPASGSSFAAGTSITFTTTVTYTSSPTPTGTVKFTLDGTVINSGVTLSSGTASLSAVVSAVGSHTLSVSYSGDANYGVAGPVTRSFTVTAAAVKTASTVKLSATTPTAACKAVSFAAAVTSSSAAKPTGTVTLKEGTTVLGTATLSNGAATLKLASMTAGTHSVTAAYSGDSIHTASTSAAFKETVTSTGACMTVHPMPVMPVQPRTGFEEKMAETK